jgi:chromosome segregation ATPase
MQYSPPEIMKAILFVTNNALVCETQEDAMKVAYGMGDGNRDDAVSLDGTYYQKSGLISGGSRLDRQRWTLAYYIGYLNLFCFFNTRKLYWI